MTQFIVNAAGDYFQVNAAGDYFQVAPPAAGADYPVVPMWREARITSFAPTFISVTHSLQRQARSRGVQAWQIDLTYGAMPRATFVALWAFLNKQDGQAGIFTLNLPQFAARGSLAGAPVVDGGAQIGRSVNLKGFTANAVGVLLTGDFIQIGNDPKVYQVTADVNATAAGKATVPLNTALRRVPADNMVISGNPLFRVAMTADTVPTDWSQCVMVEAFDISLAEILA